MKFRTSDIGIPVALLGSVTLGLLLAWFRPGLLNRYDLLAALIFIQLLGFILWKLERRFFPFLMIIFLWAGSNTPFSGIWTSARWVVLAAGSIAGYILYMKNRQYQLGVFHLVAAFCVLSAIVSAIVSSNPTVASLKAVSLLLLFLYASTGARLAASGRAKELFSMILWGCELLLYGAAFCYFVVRWQLLGNPNSLGALMGVVGIPMMLWGTLISEKRWIRRRRTLALMLAVLLLLSSYARAGIAAGVLSFVLLCVALKKYRLLVQGIVVGLLAASLVATWVPLQEAQPGSLTSAFLYKGKEEQGILGSRRSVWDETAASIQEHPWFGTGFGTSATAFDKDQVDTGGRYESDVNSSREHGDSFLAIAEWVGLLGVVPFFTLVLLTGRNVFRGFTFIRQTGDVHSPVVPMTTILAAGLVHAGFEDWLFAVGYYLCVFFWINAFLLIDALPTATIAAQVQPIGDGSPWLDRFGMIHPGR